MVVAIVVLVFAAAAALVLGEAGVGPFSRAVVTPEAPDADRDPVRIPAEPVHDEPSPGFAPSVFPDIVPMGAGTGTDHLIQTEITVAIRPHERARALVRLGLALAAVAVIAGGVIIVLARMVGAFFTRFSS